MTAFLVKLAALLWLFFYIGKPAFQHYLMTWRTDEDGVIFDPVLMYVIENYEMSTS